MKKVFKFYSIIWAVLLALFNVISFVSVGWAGISKYTPSFWIGYAFITLSFIGQIVCAYFALKDNDIKKTFTANQVVKMNQDEIQDTNNSFTYVLNKKDNFVYFAFETGQDNVKISTDLSFEEIFDYNIDFNKPYSIEADLGDGNKTYKIYVSKTPIQSVPNKLYMKSR